MNTTRAMRAVDTEDRARSTKHRMRLRAAYLTALAEICGPGAFDEIDLKSNDVLDQMVSNMVERAKGEGGRLAFTPDAAALAAVEDALREGQS